MKSLPYDILEAMIQCFGRCFWLKDIMESFLLSAGVDRALVAKYRDEGAKFIWARKVLTELGQSNEGQLTLRRVLTHLVNLRNLPDDTVPNPDAGLQTLRGLKELALKHQVIVRKEAEKSYDRQRIADQKAALAQARSKKLESLKVTFSEAVSNPNRQQSGYSLEDLLLNLFSLFEIEYRKSIRTETQQIDGHFRFEGFDYLVEAKWRRDMPPESEILGFKGKVENKLESTRGLFVSVAGFRSEVIRQFEGRGANVIFMDGADLTYLLEGEMDLRDALKFKLERAAQRGKVFVRLQDRHKVDSPE